MIVHGAQSQETPGTPEVRADFFSGVIVEMSTERLTVSRVAPSNATESREFLLNPETRVEGRLRRQARVTVRYVTTDQGNVAVHIIVREGR